MDKIYFTSDSHFCHDKEFLYGGRGFSSSDEMNKEIIKRWNSVVDKDDIVYHLGDMVLSDIDEGIKCIKQLNGQIHLIIGNHDTDKKIEEYQKCSNIVSIDFAQEIKYKKIRFFLCHYPAITRTLDDKPNKQGIINLHGHTHQKENFRDIWNPYVYHVGMDSHNLTPVLIDDIIEEISQRKRDLQSVKNTLDNQKNF